MPELDIRDGRIHIKSLEVFAAARCNLRCEHCAASAQYVMEHHSPDLDVLERTLRQLSRVMHSTQVKVLGGEPLLNKELPALLAAIHNSEFCDRIRICTNGALLERMPDAFWQHADIVEVSVYPNTPGAPSEPQLREYQQIAQQFGAVLEFNQVTHFQEALLTEPIPDPALVQKIFDVCCEAHVWPCHCLEGTTFMLCSRVHNLERRLGYMGKTQLELVEEAGISISSRESLYEELVAYMQRRQPFKACQFCLGTSGRRVENRQLTANLTKLQRQRGGEPFGLHMLDFDTAAVTPATQRSSERHE